jgi:hypothetical protein
MNENCKMNCPYLETLQNEIHLQNVLDLAYTSTPLAHFEIEEKYSSYERESIDCTGPITVEVVAAKSLLRRRKNLGVEQHLICPRI